MGKVSFTFQQDEFIEKLKTMCKGYIVSILKAEYNVGVSISFLDLQIFVGYFMFTDFNDFFNTLVNMNYTVITDAEGQNIQDYEVINLQIYSNSRILSGE